MKKIIYITALLCGITSSISFAQNFIWAKSAGGTSSDKGYSIAADANGNTYITSSFASSTITFGTTTLTNADTNGSTDIFVVKLSGAVGINEKVNDEVSI